MHNERTKKIVLLGTLALFLSYGLYQMHDALWGSSFTVHSNTVDTDTSIYTLTGYAPKTQALVINGREVSVDTKGVFSEPVVLLPGYNVVTIARTDFFKNTKTKTMTLYYTPKEGDQVAIDTKSHTPTTTNTTN